MTKKTGNPRGRPKGSVNKRNAGLVIAQREGISPLEFLLDVMDDENNELPVRMDAAKAASPYVHARLQSVVVQEKPYEGDPNSITNEQLAGIIARSGSLDDDAEAESERVTH